VDSEPDVERFWLPRPKRAVWVVVAVVGVATAGLGIAVLAGDPLNGLPVAYVAAGAGLFLAFFAVGMLMLRERASILEFGGRGLGIETVGGDEVVLPWSSLRQAMVMPRGEGQDSVVALRKADGGWIEIAAFGDADAARDIVERLQDAIASRSASGETVIPRFESLAGISVQQEGERTLLSWSATSFGALLALGPFAGLFVAVYGFHRNQPSIGTLVALGFVAALGVIAVVFTLVDVGAEQRLVLGAEELTIQRIRMGKPIDERSLPLAAIAAVDYSHRLNVLGASSLTIRTDEARLASEGAEREAASAPDDVDALELGAALLKAMAGGIHVPLGRLPLATRVGLDLALSEAIARRAGRPAGSV